MFSALNTIDGNKKTKLFVLLFSHLIYANILMAILY